MRTERITIEYRLTFGSAFHLGSGMRAGLVDRLVVRDGAGFLYVPGSTIKGVLRERCEQLAALFDLEDEVTPPHVEDWREADRDDPDIVARIFGTRFSPGSVYFDDARMIEEDRALFESESEDQRAQFRAWQVERRTQVSLSRRTRTAQHGMLYTSEFGVPSLRFEGCLTGILEGIALADSEIGTFPLLLLVSGLLSLEQIGGNKSTGGGGVTCEIAKGHVTVDRQALPMATLLAELPYFGLYRGLRREAHG